MSTPTAHVLHRRRGVVGVPNATALDERLTYRALGLLLAMLARPTGASFDMRAMAEGEGREGRDALLASAKLLRQLGYLHSVKVSPGRGQYVTHTVVSDTPMVEGEAAEILADRGVSPGSGFQTPADRTPENLTPSLELASLRSPNLKNHAREKPKPATASPLCPSCGVRATGQAHALGPCALVVPPTANHIAELRQVVESRRQVTDKQERPDDTRTAPPTTTAPPAPTQESQ